MTQARTTYSSYLNNRPSDLMGKGIGVYMLRPNRSDYMTSPFSFINEVCTLHAINEHRTLLYQLNRLRWLFQFSWYLIISLAFTSSMVLTSYASDTPSGHQEVSSLLELLDEETVDKFDLGELVDPPPNALPRTSKIFVVTAKDILNLNARNVGDALRFVPGLIFSEGGTKNPKLASLPGLATRQYVVFINDRPVYNPYFGDVDLNNLPINIENSKDCTWGEPQPDRKCDDLHR